MSLRPKLKDGIKFKTLYLLLFVAIVGAAGYFIFYSRAAGPNPPPAPTIYLSPSLQTFAANTTFTVTVRENSGTTPVNAVQANFSYPAALVDFIGIDGTGSPFTTEAQASGASGQVNIARAIIGSLTGDQLVATVTFKTKTTGGAVNMAFTSNTALVSSASNTDILGSLSATGGGAYTIDTTAPTVSLTAPVNGATISGGSTTSITATASDNTSVSSVDILVDGVLKTSLTTSPYTYSWSTAGLALGSHTIQAKANDPYGNSTSTSLITVTLADQTPPTVSISTPASGATITGTTSINATASDGTGGTGVNKVEFYVDGTLKTTDTTTPYSYSWDSKTVTDGSHSLTAKAYDNASPVNSKTSTAVNVTVDNADHQPPTQPGSLRMTGNTLTSVTLAWNASTDNVGVTGYRIQRNGSTLTTTSSLSFTDTGLTATTSYNYTVVALDAASNASPAATLSASTVSQKPGDIDGDNSVSIVDLSILLSKWNTSDVASDLNRNGKVDIFDLSILLSHYGT